MSSMSCVRRLFPFAKKFATSLHRWKWLTPLTPRRQISSMGSPITFNARLLQLRHPYHPSFGTLTAVLSVAFTTDLFMMEEEFISIVIITIIVIQTYFLFSFFLLLPIFFTIMHHLTYFYFLLIYCIILFLICPLQGQSILINQLSRLKWQNTPQNPKSAGKTQNPNL